MTAQTMDLPHLKVIIIYFGEVLGLSHFIVIERLADNISMNVQFAAAVEKQ